MATYGEDYIMPEEEYERLQTKHPNMPPELVRALGKTKVRKLETIIKREIKKRKKEALKRMKKVSKHMNTQQFNEWFAEYITPEATAQVLYEVMSDGEERTEHRLKAIQEIHKYCMVPSQAQEIRHEIDDSWNADKEDELQRLIDKAQNI